VTMFLTPGVNLRLRSKLLKELKPGSRIVCHRFDMGSWAPTNKVSFQNDQIYLWVVPSQTPDFNRSIISTSVKAPLSREKAESLFSYDSTAPLNFHSDESLTADGPQVTRISYSGARGPVSATLVTPPRRQKNPAVIFCADYGRKDEFLSEALLLARATIPAVSLIIDGPAERPLGWRRNFNSLSDDDNDRDIHIQAVVDIRRGIDLLSTRDDVDANRIAYVGHGYGANWGAILGSIETRVRAFVLIAGFPSFGELVGSDDPDWANVRYALGGDRVARYQNSISAVDPILFTRYWKRAAVLLQFGRFDEFVSREMADRLANSIPSPHQTVFYDSGHSVNAPFAAADRAKFLTRQIQARPPTNATATKPN
jgi:cephalosporin-C deacetylase-like acetyl esterase